MQTGELHRGANSSAFVNARANRQHQTEAEALLWQHLRNRRLAGHKFRRQHPLLTFIADFYCHESNLVIELDGGYHKVEDQQIYDQGRTFELEENGIHVIRFINEEVIQDIEQVLLKIKQQLR